MGETFDQAKGRAKQAAGDLTDDDELKAKGKDDERLGKAKGALNDLRDKAEDLLESAKDKVDDVRDKH
ncbi:MAG: CsbD family protein [Acidimicrobiales bacterium]